MRKLVLLSAIGSLIAMIMKRQRDRELDEAIWEEPRGL